MKKKIIATIILSAVVFGGAGTMVGKTMEQREQPKQVVTIGDTDLQAYNWLEHSGEARALKYQAYNQATEQLKKDVKIKTQKPKAVILDIDETVVNNKEYLGWQIKNDKSYSKESYTKWVNQNKATAISGAVEFTNEAEKMGVTVFYVSNRYEKEDLQGTIKNLKSLGFPNADSKHILLVDSKNHSKQPRFDKIAKSYDVVMQVGDSLCDFSNEFEHKDNVQEREIVKGMKEDFGTKYIIIPNDTYGNWESAMFNYNFKQTEQQKIQDKRDGIIATQIN